MGRFVGPLMGSGEPKSPLYLIIRIPLIYGMGQLHVEGEVLLSKCALQRMPKTMAYGHY